MANQVANTASCKCMFGSALGTLTVPPASRCMACGQPAATITDMVVTPFGMCSNPANPATMKVIAGVVTMVPQPCTPVLATPWAPGSPTIYIGGKPALSSTSVLMCAYGGSIQVASPMATTVMVP